MPEAAPHPLAVAGVPGAGGTDVLDPVGLAEPLARRRPGPVRPARRRHR
ncbi:hypothetical protein [Streptomyces humi]